MSVSRAKVSIGLRRPPSWIASNPHCLKSSEPVSAAGISDCAGATWPKSRSDRTAKRIARVFTGRAYGRAVSFTTAPAQRPVPERLLATELSAELILPSTLKSARKFVLSAVLPDFDLQNVA